MRRGLVIGKFYPPHAGHHFLIRTAEEGSDHLTVVVCDDPAQDIPAALRAAWLREVHPQADVMVVPDARPPEDSRAWAAYTREFLGYVPDVVFTSEKYGEAYARHLGCVHVSVDPKRRTVPISGTAVRNNPHAAWEYLSAPVRAWYAKRIIVLGAESTGTTTMAQALAAQYQTVWAPEYGRLFSAAAATHENFMWRTEDFLHIADQQNRMEDALARSANKVLIGDTDSFATALWHERYMGEWSDAVEEMSAGRQPALYLLTGDDIPFVQDGLRDGEHIRHTMQQRFREVLSDRGVPCIELFGPHKERMKTAISAIDALE